MKKPVTIMTIALIFWSCSKDEIGPQYPTGDGDPSGSVYLVGEGNFGWGNAAIDVYNPSTQTIDHNSYQTMNGQPLGDVAQSMRLIDGNFFIVVNNSGKIEVVDTSDLTSTGTITGLNSPRFVSNWGSKLFVTDLYADAVSVVDMGTQQITGSIPVGQWSEQVTTWQNKVFVSLPSDSIVLQIDPVTETVQDTIHLRPGPGKAVVDINDKLWILCSGNANRAGALFRVDPVALTVEKELAFAGGDSPGKLQLAGVGDTLVYYNSGVYKTSIYSNALPSTPFIDLQNITLYGLGVDPSNGEVYVSDALNFTSQSRVYRYSSTGVLIDDFQGPIICGEISFR